MVHDRSSRARPPHALAVGFLLFLAGIAYLLASSLARRDMPTFAPSVVAARGAADASRLVDTLTVDARDEASWRFVSLGGDGGEGGARVRVAGDTSGWDLAVRRHRIMVADAIADAGAIPFDSVSRAPAAGYRGNGADSVNAALAHWYDYNVVTHLLRPARRVYVVRRRSGRYAKLELLSYYCPRLVAGCLSFRSAALSPPSAP